jgi:hypothetical protein
MQQDPIRHTSDGDSDEQYIAIKRDLMNRAAGPTVFDRFHSIEHLSDAGSS